MYWFEHHAQQILKNRGDKLVVATGITPSGPIHVGNLREILTADFVVKEIGDRADITFYYIADDFDPLRKVYPFLDKSFEQHIGKPYFLIPCPCSNHNSYADHFLEPFLGAVKELGITVKMLRVSELYRSGKYTEAIKKAIEGRDAIKKIFEEVSQRKLEAHWFPFNPLCSKCQKLRGRVVDFDLKKNIVTYECLDCGSRGVADFSKGQGKLPWRIDWPARWWMLGVNVEPFGKDHASKGGSFETGERIAKEIFNSPAPYPIVYERVHLRGQGAMHSSTGVAIEAAEILKAVSPTVLRFFFARSQNDRHLDFEPGEGVVQLYDEYQVLGRKDPLHRISTVEPLPAVPYRHLVMVYQTAMGKLGGVIETLSRTGHGLDDKKSLESLLKKIAVWLDRYAPERYKFSIRQHLPSSAKNLTDAQTTFLAAVLELFQSKKSWQGEQLHSEIHELRKRQDIEPKQAFTAIYTAFVGEPSGPQAGWFLATLDRDFVIDRLKEVPEV